jgi:hypothetical protein
LEANRRLFGRRASAAAGHVFGLLRGAGRRLLRRDLVALADVALPLPDDGRGGRVLSFRPSRGAAVLAEAVQGTVQRRQVDVAVGKHGRGDDLASDPLFPQLASATEIKGAKVVLVVTLAVGVGDVDAAAAQRRHAHQGIAQPLFSDRPALDREHFQLVALGVKGDVAVAHDRGRGSVVGGLVLPADPACVGVEGVKVVAAEAGAEKYKAVGDGRRG